MSDSLFNLFTCSPKSLQVTKKECIPPEKQNNILILDIQPDKSNFTWVYSICHSTPFLDNSSGSQTKLFKF